MLGQSQITNWKVYGPYLWKQQENKLHISEEASNYIRDDDSGQKTAEPYAL